MVEGSKAYVKEAINLALIRVKIMQCQHCGHPTLNGYHCPYCGNDDLKGICNDKQSNGD